MSKQKIELSEVTIERLSTALRTIGFKKLSLPEVDALIDLVELIANEGGETSLDKLTEIREALRKNLVNNPF